MTEEENEMVFISGPLIGELDFEDHYSEAEESLKENGYSVMNPSLLPGELNEDKRARISLAMLAECDTIALLPGWQYSRSAIVELAEAIKQEKAIIVL